MVYPLLFTPIYKEMIWGGRKLQTLFGREIPYTHTGESWDISCRPDDVSVIANGPLAGHAFTDVILSREWVGENLSASPFPLLIKLIDAQENLSVQVHPNDVQAARVEQEPFGKNEMWYVLDAPKEAALIIGLADGVTKEQFSYALSDSGSTDPEQCLGRMPIQKGDVIFIPAGLIHALTKGVMVAEIQQNSNRTYRVYDYHRLQNGKPRELHIDKALAVIDFDNRLPRTKIAGLTVENLTYYIANPYFAIIEYKPQSPLADFSDPDKFFLFTCVSGSCQFAYESGEIFLTAGESLFLPAALGAYEIIPQNGCRLLKSFVPDTQKDFIMPLTNAGFSMDEIRQNTAVNL